VRALTGLLGAIAEAWSELRVNRTRVLLSLIGVAVAVTALTVVVGAGALVTQQQQEQQERASGRPAMLYVGAYSQPDGMSAPASLMQPAFDAAAERYKIAFAARSTYINEQARLPRGVTGIGGMAVDVDYGTMHRVKPVEGRWFVDADENRFAPAVLINQKYWTLIGSPPLQSHPTIELEGESPTTAVVIGVTASGLDQNYPPEVTMLYSTWLARTSVEMQQQTGSSFEYWVPPEVAEELQDRLSSDFRLALGKGYQTDVYRQDYLAWGQGDPLLPLKLAVGGIAGLVLLLGALGLVNISLVTVRHRIREIGIRRSFGATAGRVFFAVMMESVVATVAAGFVGVAVAIAIVQNPWVQQQLGGGVIDVPPFPIEAAIFGLVAAAGVGALAGLMPAIVAVRVKVIDAIRY
jgi:putative ABC transport system permease protein